MCPPAQPPPAEIGVYWSDEQIIAFLDVYSPGSNLPSNVLEDSGPYQYPPANLPEGIWYLVQSNAPKESTLGYWRAKGEACKIYSNSVISGWRTTLQYFEGRMPHGRGTDWHMQEYTITQKDLCDKNKIKEPKSLCRVFHCSGNSSNTEMNSRNNKAVVVADLTDLEASSMRNIDVASGRESGVEAKETDCKVELPPASDIKPNSYPEILSDDQECFLKGDYLELNDLEDHESDSSSSQNSSCPSKLSDECFDSLALLRDLEEEENRYMQEKHSTSRYSVTTPVQPTDMIMQPASSGCVLRGGESTSVAQSTQTCSTISTDEIDLELATKRRNHDVLSEGHSGFSDVSTSSTSDKNASHEGEKKTSAGRMKKLKLCFCFMPF